MRAGIVIVMGFALAACGGDDTGAQTDAAPAADANPSLPDAGSDEPTARSACGLEYQWLEASEVGAVVASDSHSSVSKGTLNLVRAALIANDQPWGRSVDYPTQLHELRYTTQDRGALVEATGYYITPVVDTPQEFPVVVLLHGTTGLNDECAPSRNLDDSESDNFQYAALLSLIASNGYIVVAPDYIGLKATGASSTELHPYLVGEVAAIGSWDLVRAATSHLAADTGSAASPGPIAVWGASQGGHAAAFAVRFAPSYAPEMNVVTGVYSVPPLDLAAHWQAGLTSPRAATGFIIMAFAGMADWYQATLSDVFLSPYDTEVPADLRDNCRPSTLDGLSSLDELFQAQLLADNAELALGGERTPWSCAIEDNTLATTSIPRTDSVPSLVVTGELDTLVETAIERQNLETLCATGNYDDWRYLECAGAGHSEGFLWAIDDALDWIDERVAGTPLTGTCGITSPVTCGNTP